MDPTKLSDADLMAALSTPRGVDLSSMSDADLLAALKASPKTINDLPDFNDPNGPDYRRRFGGPVVTGFVDAAGKAISDAGKAARGEMPAADPETGHTSEEMIGAGANMALVGMPTAPARLTTQGLRGIPRGAQESWLPGGPGRSAPAPAMLPAPVARQAEPMLPAPVARQAEPMLPAPVARQAEPGAVPPGAARLPPPEVAFPNGAPRSVAGEPLTREELKQAARDAYQASEEANVFIKPAAVQRLSTEIKSDLADFGYKPRLAPKVAGFLDDLDAATEADAPHTLKSLDLLRQEAGLIARSQEPAEKEIARQVIKKIDKHLESLTERDILPGGDIVKGATAIKDARALWRANKKSEIIEEATQRAQRRAEGSGSGGNIDNALRQQMRRIIESPRLSKTFTREELAAMRLIIRGSKTQDIARLVGKLSPEGNGLMMAIQMIGGAGTGGATLPLAGVGFAAKRYADSVTPRRIGELDKMVRTVKRR